MALPEIKPLFKIGLDGGVKCVDYITREEVIFEINPEAGITNGPQDLMIRLTNHETKDSGWYAVGSKHGVEGKYKEVWSTPHANVEKLQLLGEFIRSKDGNLQFKNANLDRRKGKIWSAGILERYGFHSSGEPYICDFIIFPDGRVFSKATSKRERLSAASELLGLGF